MTASWICGAAPLARAADGPARTTGANPSAAGDPNLYVADVDTDVTYDDVLASSYDDGYGPKTYLQFEAALRPYGRWIDDPSFGRIWKPDPERVGADFVPYATGGHWLLTEYGFTWESDWEWGWAPFHYGRWIRLAGEGWVWVPGALWSPAWVAWRAGRTYAGWAPLPPRGVHLGRPIGPASPWRFVRGKELLASDLTFVPLRAVPPIFGRTAAVSRTRPLRTSGLVVRVNEGPTKAKFWRDSLPTPVSLVTFAPHAIPALAIKPRLGIPLASRPWAEARAVEQTPLCRWGVPCGS